MAKVNLGALRETLFEAIKDSDVGLVRLVLVEAGKSKKPLLTMPIKVEGISEEVDALTFARIIEEQRPHSHKKRDVVNAITATLEAIRETTTEKDIVLSSHENWPEKAHLAFPPGNNNGQPLLTMHEKKLRERRDEEKGEGGGRGDRGGGRSSGRQRQQRPPKED